MELEDHAFLILRAVEERLTLLMSLLQLIHREIEDVLLLLAASSVRSLWLGHFTVLATVDHGHLAV